MSTSDPDAIVAAGQEIYNRKYRQEYEQTYPDYFAVINVGDESIYRGEAPVDALRLAEESAPEGQFYLLRVGHPCAYRMSAIA